MNEQLDQANLPRCSKHDGTTLKIVPAFTEPGAFEEVNAVTITDGERTAVYVPANVARPSSDNDGGLVGRRDEESLKDRLSYCWMMLASRGIISGNTKAISDYMGGLPMSISDMIVDALLNNLPEPQAKTTGVDQMKLVATS